MYCILQYVLYLHHWHELPTEEFQKYAVGSDPISHPTVVLSKPDLPRKSCPSLNSNPSWGLTCVSFLANRRVLSGNLVLPRGLEDCHVLHYLLCRLDVITSFILGLIVSFLFCPSLWFYNCCCCCCCCCCC